MSDPYDVPRVPLNPPVESHKVLIENEDNHTVLGGESPTDIGVSYLPTVNTVVQDKCTHSHRGISWRHRFCRTTQSGD